MILKCPACHQALNSVTEGSSRTLRCENNHSYDFAKEGYINLLLAQKKRSKNPGDDNAMMQCRQGFLNRGYYQFLVVALTELLKQYQPHTVLDVGCGEGYYGNALKEQAPKIELLGFDIAKGGVKLAAKRGTYDQLAVASAYDIPVMSETIDLALSIFSPLDDKELARVLTEKGILIAVGPATNHLKALAEHVYDQFKPHQNGFAILDKSPLFENIDTLQIEQESTITGEDIFNLLTMTPYYWSASEEKQQAIKKLETLTTPLAFQIKLYRRV